MILNQFLEDFGTPNPSKIDQTSIQNAINLIIDFWINADWIFFHNLFVHACHQLSIQLLAKASPLCQISVPGEPMHKILNCTVATKSSLFCLHARYVHSEAASLLFQRCRSYFCPRTLHTADSRENKPMQRLVCNGNT